MSKKEDHSYRNPAYIYEEGRSGGGPDSTSASSVSSRSSMKFIGSKLKTHGNRRWLIVGAVVIVVVIIIAIAMAVLFTQDKSEDASLPRVNADAQTDNATSTRPPSIMPPVSTSSTPAPPTRRTEMTSSEKPTTSTGVETQTPSTIPPFISTTPVDRSTPSNLSVSLSDVLFQPDDVKTLTLTCTGRHSGDWNTLTIRRQFKDSYDTLGTLINDPEGDGQAVLFYANVTQIVVINKYEVTLRLTFDPFTCEDLTNFTCALETNIGTVSAESSISIFLPTPQIQLPHSIIEDREITLKCLAEVWERNSSVVWKFRPAESTMYMEFSVLPVNTIIQKNCTDVINSSLTFNPTMFENGTDFRCEVTSGWKHPQVIQERFAKAELLVVPSNFCDNKRQFGIYPHPHGPCTVVVYCLNSGPLVYEIECNPGQCYDPQKTACVPSP